MSISASPRVGWLTKLAIRRLRGLVAGRDPLVAWSERKPAPPPAPPPPPLPGFHSYLTLPPCCLLGPGGDYQHGYTPALRKPNEGNSTHAD